MSTHFSGTFYKSITGAANAWAYNAAPDAGMFSASDSPRTEAEKLAAYVRGELEQAGVKELPIDNGCVVEADRWDEYCVDALERLIADYVADARAEA